jgi:exonuclease III
MMTSAGLQQDNSFNGYPQQIPMMKPIPRLTTHNVKIMTINCAGLTPITETQIRQLIETEGIHITLLQETKRTSTEAHTQYLTYTQSGHSVIALNHTSSQHGLQTWVNRHLPTTFLHKYSHFNNNLEYITIRLHYLIIINVYRKHTNIIPALQELDSLISTLQQNYPNDTIIIAGDMNAQYLPTVTTCQAKHKHFTSWIHTTQLMNASQSIPTRLDPRTRTQSAIDHVLAKPQQHTIEDLYLPPFGHITSDHRPIILNIKRKEPQVVTWKPHFKWKKHYKQIINDIQKEPAPTIAHIQTVFQQYIQHHHTTTHKIPIPRHWYKPTQRVRQLLKESKTKKRHKDPTYQLTQKQLRQAIRTDKKKQFRKFLDATNNERDQKIYYRNIRHLKLPKTWTTDPAFGKEDEILGQLNYDTEHTHSQTKKLLTKLNSYTHTNADTFSPFTIQDLHNTLKKLPQRKSPGWDHIPYEFWAQLPHSILKHLINDINNILKNGNITSNLSHTIIKPIPKSSTTADIRPISLLPTITKIIEKLLKHRLQDWLHQKHLLTDAQFAYRPHHSASTQAHRLIHNIATNKRHHKKIALLSLDLTKAFDKVNTYKLITKLMNDQAPAYLVHWIAGTLIHRPIQVLSNHTLSSIAFTSTGILQGGTLAPMQFTYYINSTIHKPLPDTHSIYAFADDLALLITADTQTQLERRTHTAVHTLLRRLEELHCEISYQKTKLMTFNCRIPYIHYKQHKINHTKQHKILGITIDKTLTFNTHTHQMLKKMNTALTWLKGIAKHFHIQKRRTLTIQYVLSILDYSLLAIYPFLSNTNRKKINTVISQTARFILQTPSSTPTTFSLLEAQLMNLEHRALYLAINHFKRHHNHTNPLCLSLTNSFQYHHITCHLSPELITNLHHTPPKTLLQHIRLHAHQQLAEHKPTLAKYIAQPQKRLTHTTALMTRLRTGHARTNHWLARMRCIPPTPCRLCGLEPETIHHLLVACPHPHAMKERQRKFFKKFPGLIQETPEEQLQFLLTRAPPPQIQKVKESTITAYLQALNIQL